MNKIELPKCPHCNKVISLDDLLHEYSLNDYAVQKMEPKLWECGRCLNNIYITITQLNINFKATTWEDT